MCIRDRHLRECWNEAKLVNDIYPDSPFMKGIESIAEKFFIKDSALYVNNKINKDEESSLWSKVRQWLSKRR